MRYEVARGDVSFLNEKQPGFKELCYSYSELMAMSQPGVPLEKPLTHEERIEVVRNARKELYTLNVCCVCDQFGVEVEQKFFDMRLGRPSHDIWANLRLELAVSSVQSVSDTVVPSTPDNGKQKVKRSRKRVDAGVPGECVPKKNGSGVEHHKTR